MKPQRIQRSRAKGWRMPENTVYVGRPSIWGNPVDWRDYTAEGFQPSSRRAREWAVAVYRDWLSGRKGTGIGGLKRVTVLARLPELRGKNLSCWCALDEACHADVLLEIANADYPAEERA